MLSSGVVRIVPNYSGYAALKEDGSVVTWGHPQGGGDSSAVSDLLLSGVVGFADPFFNDVLHINKKPTGKPIIEIADENDNAKIDAGDLI